MIAAEATEGTPLEDAVRRTLRRVDGTYGLVVLDTQNPNELVVARNGSPIVLGIGESEMFVASDVAALVRYTKQVVYLDDAEVATVHAADYVTAALDERDRRRRAQDADHGGGRGRGLRARPVRELHAQGDPRAARGAAPGAARPPRRAVRHGQARRHRPGRAPAAVDQAGEVPRLRLGLLRRPDGRGADRGTGPHPLRRRARLGVQVPQSRGGPGHALRRGQPVRRDARHADGGAGTAPQGRPGHRRGQRGRQRDRPGVRPRGVPARGPGDRGLPPPRR